MNGNEIGRWDRFVTNIASAILKLASYEHQCHIRSTLQRGIDEEHADETRVFDAKFYETNPW